MRHPWLTLRLVWNGLPGYTQAIWVVNYYLLCLGVVATS